MHTENKIAIVIGATGLVGKALVLELCKDAYFKKIIVFHRRSIELDNPKIEEHIINFDSLETWSHLINGDVVFSCMGTTLNTAGSKQAQYLVDYTYQYTFAKAACTNGVKSLLLVSSAGANEKSKVFYLKMKGELEKALAKLSFKCIYFIRPNLLVGERKEIRIGEVVAEKILYVLNKIGLFRSQTPITATNVAKNLIFAYKEGRAGLKILEGKTLRNF